MMRDFRLSGKKPSHRIGDFRIGLKSSTEAQNNFALIGRHNRNVAEAKKNLTNFSQGGTRKITNGVVTEIRCGINRKVIVKTYRDGTSQVEEQNG